MIKLGPYNAKPQGTVERSVRVLRKNIYYEARLKNMLVCRHLGH